MNADLEEIDSGRLIEVTNGWWYGVVREFCPAFQSAVIKY